MKDRSSVGGQRKGDFIPIGDFLNLFYEFVRVYIRIFSIFIDRYLIFLVLIQELEVYIDTACLAVIDRTDKPILSLFAGDRYVFIDGSVRNDCLVPSRRHGFQELESRLSLVSLRRIANHAEIAL